MLVILVILHMASSSRQDVVSLAQGMVRGEVREGVVSYRGIPYATIDGESGRFKEAGVAPTWSGIRESQPARCSLVSELEDCLQLEVHVPSAEGGPWPVLAWMRGGSGHYDPWKMVQSGIVVVVISHRFNAPGFLCLGDESIPGNAGVKDVVHALRWIRDNVAAFNGSPHRVVVAGQGLGAAMAELLTLAPVARDLLHGAIAQSGGALCPWSFNYDARERAQSFMRIVEDNESSNVTRVDVKNLVRYSDEVKFPYYPFGMCVENSSQQQNKLIEHSPYRLLTDAAIQKIPIIVGYNSDEAYVFVSNLQSNVLGKMRDVSKLLPQELQFTNAIEKADTVKQIQNRYFKRNRTIAALLSYYRDAYFVNHVYRSARLHARVHRPVYFYQFSRTSELGVSPVSGVRKTGAAHSDELSYLFASRGTEMDASAQDLQRNLLRLWTNFVKYLNPTPNNDLNVRWEPFDESDSRLLDIDIELKMKSFPHKHTSEVWDDIFQQFYYGRNVS